MTKLSIVSLLLVSACGSKSPPPATPGPGNTGTTTAPATGRWEALASKGASWKLIGADFDPAEVTVTVTDVVATDAGREVRLAWRDADGNEALGPASLVIAKDGLYLDGSLAVEEPPREIEEQSREDGRYVRFETTAGEQVICFGWGPGPDAGECEDVCFGEMCVAEKSGIVAVSGTWAPSQAFYTQAGFEK